MGPFDIGKYVDEKKIIIDEDIEFKEIYGLSDGPNDKKDVFG